MKLTYQSIIEERSSWERAGVRLPAYDILSMRKQTQDHPRWIHFGAGNIFRAFMACLQQRLLEEGAVQTGIVAAEAFDPELIDRLYRPWDDLSILVTLHADGRLEKELIASVGKSLAAVPDSNDMDILRRMMRNPFLQMVSLTVTEKGYALRDMNGNYLPEVQKDLEAGPGRSRTLIGLIAGLVYHRFENGAFPLALVSMDNCAHNGEKLESAVLELAGEWYNKGLVDQDFLTYLQDESQISFPWTMIDKITPRPSNQVLKELEEAGIEGMEPITTSRHTYAAAFVNAEAPQYLVIEDTFPNGRPPLERAGVYFTDRETVSQTERMKVTACLNPLHTALAVYGCLLGYPTIASEMKDPALVRLVRGIGEKEGMPVVVNPGILDPAAFLKEVLEERLPNTFLPDTPQRIATDTSQKISVRYGETIRAYMRDPERELSSLRFIPLAIAGWCRYLLGVDDELKKMELSPDPMLEPLRAILREVQAGRPETYRGQLRPVLANPVIMGTDLTKTCLSDKIETLFQQMLEGEGAVRRVLDEETL